MSGVTIKCKCGGDVWPNGKCKKCGNECLAFKGDAKITFGKGEARFEA